MKFKIKLCVLLTALLLLCTFPTFSVEATEIIDSGTCGENLTWTLTEDGTLTISGTGNMNDSSFNSPFSDYSWDITNVIIENGVTSIGDCAFYDCSNLTQIAIPDSVNSIGTNAFYYCSSLAYITLPDSITFIGSDAFYECSSLTQVALPASLSSISDSTFYACSGLTSVSIPDGIASIGDNAFCHCSSLISVTLPDSITSIGSYAFYACSSLTSVVFSANVKYIDSNAFAYCDSLEELTFRGAAPVDFDENTFQDQMLTIHYPNNLPGWTEAITKNYGAEKIDWIPYIAWIDLEGATMTLSNSLSMNFVVDMDLLPEGEYYALIVRYYPDGSLMDVVKCDQNEWGVYDEEKNQMYFSYHDIAAKEMIDILDVVIVSPTYSQVSNAWRDSPRNYCMRAIRDEEAETDPNEDKLALYVDMLNYGAAAQTYFGYKTDDLANEDLSDVQKAYATTDEISVTSKQVKPNEGYKGGSLTLVNEIRLNFVFFTEFVTQNMYAIATYTDHYGNKKEVRIEGEDFKKESSNTLLISVTGMAVADYDQAVTCTVYGANGAVISATDSVASYVLRAKASEAGNPLFDAVLKFGWSAYKTFKK